MGNNMALGMQGQGGGGYGGHDDVSIEIVDHEVMRRQRKEATWPRQQFAINLPKRDLTPYRDPNNESNPQSQNKKLSQENFTDKIGTQMRIMGSDEFDFYKRKANAMAVSALKNSDTIPWQNFKEQLEKALLYYERTPGLELLYREVSNSTKDEGQTNDNIAYPFKDVNEDKKLYILKMFTTMKLASKDGDGPLYIEEIIRIQKSKCVILRALIQNMYIQMQGTFQDKNKAESEDLLFKKQSKKKEQLNEKRAKQMDELLLYLLKFTDISNMTVRFVVEQLGEEHVKPGNLQIFQANSADSNATFKRQNSKAISEQYKNLPMGRINDPGPGGSPNEIQERSSVNVISARNMLSNSNDKRSPKSCNLAGAQIKGAKEPPQIWTKRYIEALQNCQFLFQDKFIKSLLQIEKDFRKKLEFLKRIYTEINPYNFEYLRKISWHISKIFYKKAMNSQNQRNLEAAEKDNLQAAFFLRRFEEYTQIIDQNLILSEAKFLANDTFSDITSDEVEKHKVRIDNLQNIITYLLQQQGVQARTERSNTSIPNLQQLDQQTPSRIKQSQQLTPTRTKPDLKLSKKSPQHLRQSQLSQTQRRPKNQRAKEIIYDKTPTPKYDQEIPAFIKQTPSVRDQISQGPASSQEIFKPTMSQDKQSQGYYDQTPSKIQINQQELNQSKERADITPPIATAPQTTEQPAQVNQNTSNPQIFVEQNTSEQPLRRVRTRRISDYEREESAVSVQQSQQRQDTTYISKKERSPISRHGHTPKARVQGDGDHFNEDLALEPDEEEGQQQPPANVNVAQPSDKIKSRADTGSSLATVSPFKSGLAADKKTENPQQDSPIMKQKPISHYLHPGPQPIKQFQQLQQECDTISQPLVQVYHQPKQEPLIQQNMLQHEILPVIPESKTKVVDMIPKNINMDMLESNTPDTGIGPTSSKDLSAANTNQEKKVTNITKISVQQPKLVASPTSQAFDQEPSPTSDATAAIINLELGNQKRSVPSKATSRFIPKKFDEQSVLSEYKLSKRHQSQRSQAILQAAQIRQEQLQLSKMGSQATNKSRVKSLRKITGRQTTRAMMVKSPAPLRNDVISEYGPASNRSRSKTPKGLLTSRAAYNRKGGYLPAMNTSRPNIINCSTNQFKKIGKSKQTIDKYGYQPAYQPEEIAPLRGHASSSRRTSRQQKLSKKKQNNANNVSQYQRQFSPPITIVNGKAKKKPMYLVEPNIQLSSPILKQKRRKEQCQQSFASPLSPRSYSKQKSSKQLSSQARVVNQFRADSSTMKPKKANSKLNKTKAFKRRSKLSRNISRNDSQQQISLLPSNGGISKRHKRKISFDPNQQIQKIEPQKILINLKSNQDEILLDQEDPSNKQAKNTEDDQGQKKREAEIVASVTQVEILDSLVPGDQMRSPEQNLKDLEEIYQKGLSNQDGIEADHDIDGDHDSIFDKVQTIRAQGEDIRSVQNYGKRLNDEFSKAGDEVADNLTQNLQQAEESFRLSVDRKSRPDKTELNSMGYSDRELAITNSQKDREQYIMSESQKERESAALSNSQKDRELVMSDRSQKQARTESVPISEKPPLVPSQQRLPIENEYEQEEEYQEQDEQEEEQYGDEEEYDEEQEAYGQENDDGVALHHPTAEDGGVSEQIQLQLPNQNIGEIEPITSQISQNGKETSTPNEAIQTEPQKMVEVVTPEITADAASNGQNGNGQNGQNNAANAAPNPAIEMMKQNFKNKLIKVNDNNQNKDIVGGDAPVVKNQDVVKVNDIGYIMSGEDSAAAPTMDAKYAAAKPVQQPQQPAAKKSLKPQKPMQYQPARMVEVLDENEMEKKKNSQPKVPLYQRREQKSAAQQFQQSSLKKSVRQGSSSRQGSLRESPVRESPARKNSKNARNRSNSSHQKNRWNQSANAHNSKQAQQSLIQDCMRPSTGKAKGASSKKLARLPRVPHGVSELDFEPLVLLGNGSFGDVFLVRHKTAQSGQPGSTNPGPGPLYAMKVLQKGNNKDEVWLRYVKTERDVMAYTDHPFICKLWYAFQTRSKLFLVMDFCAGGDLETLMAAEKAPLSENKAKFYIAEILLALKDLHARNIIYRDLKPDNVVIDEGGHARLIDFGMTKLDVTNSTQGAQTFCGSIKYLAPEMLKKQGHGQALDWYLLGVLLYEMVVGVTPHFSANRETLFNNIRYGDLKFPRAMSPNLKDLLTGLLRRTPGKRLGAAPGEEGARQIMRHPFFYDIDWNALMQKENNGKFSYWPGASKRSLEHFQADFAKTKLSPSDLFYVYYEDDEEDEAPEKWSDYKGDDDDGGSGPTATPRDQQKTSRSGKAYKNWRYEQEDFQNYIEDWDFMRIFKEPPKKPVVAKSPTKPKKKESPKRDGAGYLFLFE